MPYKNREFRSIVGTELAQLLSNDYLSIDDWTKGIKDFSEYIEDLKTDIPFIWNCLAEFLEQFIVSSESDISFYENIFASQYCKTDIVNCIAVCLKFADRRLGHDAIQKVMNKCSWSFNDFTGGESVDEFLISKDLTFLSKNQSNQASLFSIKDELIFLSPNNVEDIRKFMDSIWQFIPDKSGDSPNFPSVKNVCRSIDGAGRPMTALLMTQRRGDYY